MTKCFVVLFVVIAACGGDDGSIGPGDQTFDPPPETQGTGKPSGATSVTCSAASDCGNWFCRCEDGAVVNSALCVNGYCMDAASACPRACAVFNHGNWTGQAGGGPENNPPAPATCGGLGSDNQACDKCMKDECCSEAKTCGTNSSCLKYWDCVVACDGSSSCRSQCDSTYPSGKAPYEGLSGCLLDNCYNQCVGDL